MARRARQAGPAEDEAPVEEEPAVVTVRDVMYFSSDGLSLHARDYGDRLSPWLPVVCLPGLTRGVRDFHELAAHLSTRRRRSRRVVVFEYRGRGQSQWDIDPGNYNPLIEMGDAFDGMAALGVPRAVIVGTSRGGIIAMMMGVERPSSVAGIVLNDVGPVIEPRGLARIKTYIGRTPPPDDWSDARRMMQRLHGAQFTAFDDEDWDAFARMTYREVDGRPASDYDPNLGSAFDGIEFDKPIPNMWDEFRALQAIPILAIRGENSDLFTEETVKQMQAAHPRFDSLTVSGEGHSPHLRRPSLVQRIASFAASIEGQAPPPDAIIPKAHVPYDLDQPRQGEGG